MVNAYTPSNGGKPLEQRAPKPDWAQAIPFEEEKKSNQLQ